jgi:hypothetical protein
VAGGPLNLTALDLAKINCVLATTFSGNGLGFTVQPSREGHIPQPD